MYNIADKMITGCKFDFAIFAILTLQIPIACFDMYPWELFGAACPQKCSITDNVLTQYLC